MADGTSWGKDSFADPPPAEDSRSLVFPVVEPSVLETPPPRPARRVPWVALALAIAALVVIAAVRALWLRLSLPLALAVAAAAVVWVHRRSASKSVTAPSASSPAAPATALRKSGRRSLPDTRTVVLDVAPKPSIRLTSDRAGDLASLELAPGASARGSFGLVLLSSRRRDRMAVALTSSVGTMLVGTRLDADARMELADLLGRSSVHGGDESALEATSPDGRPVGIAPGSFRTLVETLVRLDPGAEGRVVLSDQRGETIRLEGDDLLVRGIHFDLSRPVEWKPIMFQEQFGQAYTLFYQGTCVRQGPNEIVLVSLLSPTMLDLSLDPRGAASFRSLGLGSVDGAALRDQRLMQQSAGDPPPIEQRVAIDGLFVMPIRAALDQAPRPSSQRPRTSYA